MAASTSTESRIAALRRSCAWSSTALVTFAVMSLMICAAIPSVVCTERSSAGLFDQLLRRIGHQAHPGHHLLLQRLGLRRADAEHFGHPEQGRRLGTGQRDHRRPQLGLGQIRAAGDQHLLHHHLAAGPDRPAEPLRLGSDLLVVDAHRPVDRVLGGQQDGRVGRHPGPQAEGVRLRRCPAATAHRPAWRRRRRPHRARRRCRATGLRAHFCGRRSSSSRRRHRHRSSPPATRRRAPTCIW